MIHNLTIGHLDPIAIADRRAVVLRPLDSTAVQRRLEELGSVEEGLWTLDGLPVILKEGYLVCRWLVGPRTNRAAEELAIRLGRDTGCVVADREHGRIVDPADLRGLAEGRAVAGWSAR